MPQATVKAYDSITKKGSLLADDGETEYSIDSSSLENSMFRFLRPGQRVTFDLVEGQVRSLRIGIA
jgi:cold shock CspA family protein